MTDMADSSTGSRLFVRQSSGLVRDVSVTNALFFNIAAFVGVGLTLYPIFYSLGFIPVWKWGPFSEYGWAAIVTGLFCVLLAIIFASLTSVMPQAVLPVSPPDDSMVPAMPAVPAVPRCPTKPESSPTSRPPIAISRRSVRGAAASTR